MSIDRSKSDEIHENSVKTQQHCQKGRCEEHRSKTSLRSISKLATCFQVVPVKPSAATNSAKRKKMDRVEGKSRKHAASIGAERRAPHIKNGAAAEENCEDGRLGRRRMHKWAAGLKYLRFLLNFLFFSLNSASSKMSTEASFCLFFCRPASYFFLRWNKWPPGHFSMAKSETPKMERYISSSPIGGLPDAPKGVHEVSFRRPRGKPRVSLFGHERAWGATDHQRLRDVSFFFTFRYLWSWLFCRVEMIFFPVVVAYQ